LTQLGLLSAIWHENLVPLIGYCCEKDQQILVYPFMSNGSLQDRLYGIMFHENFIYFSLVIPLFIILIFFCFVGEASKRKVLDWPTRLSVCIGAARGKKHLCSVNTHSACFSLSYRGIKLNILFCAIPGMSCCFVLTFGL